MDDQQHRHIRSFVRRDGRITPAQKNALQTLSARYCIEPGSELLDLDQLFGRHAPRHLEIGCGVGETILELARRHPENDYLGMEVYRSGIGNLLALLEKDGITNVRMLCEDAVQLLSHNIAPQSLDAVYIYFPDPWPKKRHHKRRLIQPGFIDLLHARLTTAGRLFIGTDWEDYADHIRALMLDQPGFINLAGRDCYAPRPDWRPLTRYERRALRLQHVIRDFAFARQTPG